MTQQEFQRIFDDHDCTASPEDGCSVCYLGQQLGCLPDFDEDAYSNQQLDT
jgi:hypothetical protein